MMTIFSSLFISLAVFQVNLDWSFLLLCVFLYLFQKRIFRHFFTSKISFNVLTNSAKAFTLTSSGKFPTVHAPPIS